AHALRRHDPWLRRHAQLGALPRSGRSPERVRMTVPRIPIAEPVLGEEELANVVEAVRSGWISSLGAFIPEFERTFAAFCGAAHGIAVANGTMALHLALVAAGVRSGDEVLVPSLTFVATPNAVTYCGARPVFVDSSPETWQLDARALEAKLTPRTKAIMPVHLYGHPCDMDPILELAEPTASPSWRTPPRPTGPNIAAG